MKIHGVTLELKGYYFTIHKEAPRKAKIIYKNFKEVLERHALKTYSYFEDLLDFFEKGMKPKLKESEESKGKKKTAQAIWNIQIKNYVKRKNILKKNLVKLYSTKLGQSSIEIRAFVEESSLYKKIHKEKDVVALDKLIKKNVCNFGASKHPSYSTLGIRLKLCTYRQRDGQSVTDYAKELKAPCNVAMMVDGP